MDIFTFGFTKEQARKVSILPPWTPSDVGKIVYEISSNQYYMGIKTGTNLGTWVALLPLTIPVEREDFMTGATGESGDSGDTGGTGSTGGTGPSAPPSTGLTNRAVFAGGNGVNTIDCICIDNPGNAIDFGDLVQPKKHTAAVSNGVQQRALFAGGLDQTLSVADDFNNAYVKRIDIVVINVQSDAMEFGNLTLARHQLGGASNGIRNRGIFSGGNPAARTNVIDCVGISTFGNAVDFGDLTRAKYGISGTSNGANGRGLFAGGGLSSGTTLNVIDMVNIGALSNAQDFGDLMRNKCFMTAVSNGIGNRALFAGGQISEKVKVNVIEYVTITTPGIAKDFGDLTNARQNPAGASSGVGNSAVFAGGFDNVYFNVIDKHSILTLGNCTKFGELTLARHCSATSNGSF